MLELRTDDLCLDGLKLNQYVNGYNFTSDSVLLANFVSTKKSDVCVEVGTGCGIISILVSHKLNPKKIYAFEIQEKMARLAKDNCKMNGKENIEVVCDKFQNVLSHVKTCDVVFANPPYFKDGTSLINPNEEKAISRHEQFLPLEELCGSVKKVLKFGGKFYVVYPASRLAELFNQLQKNNLEPKRMFLAQPNENKNASVVFVEAVHGGKSGMVVMPTLITNTLDGNYVQTIQKLYRKD